MPFINGVALLLCLLSAGKSYEIVISARWAQRHGEDFRNDIASIINKHILLVKIGRSEYQVFEAEALALWKKHRRPNAKVPDDWPVQRLLKRVKPDLLSNLILNPIFRDPTIIFSQALFLLVLHNAYMNILMSFTLLIQLLLQVYHTAINQHMMGFADSYFRQTVDFKIPNNETVADQLKKSRSRMVRDFHLLLLFVIAEISAGFAAIKHSSLENTHIYPPYVHQSVNIIEIISFLIIAMTSSAFYTSLLSHKEVDSEGRPVITNYVKGKVGKIINIGQVDSVNMTLSTDTQDDDEDDKED